MKKIGDRVYIQADGDCIVTERVTFKDQAALLRVRREKDGCQFFIEESAVIDSNLAARDALR